jgi:hypothetical protein
VTVRQRATWTAAARGAPVGPVAAVATVGAGVVALAADTPAQLATWSTLVGIVIAALAAGAVDDPTEALAAATPVGRPSRWAARAIVAGAAVAVGFVTVLAAGAVGAGTEALSPASVIGAAEVDRVASQAAAYLMVAWAAAAIAVRRRGPGVALRVAGPTVLALHLAYELTGEPWLDRLPGAAPGTTGWWVVVLAVAAAVLARASADPARPPRGMRP